MAGLREIGAAFVRLFVKKDQFSRDLKQAEHEVKQTGQVMNQEAAKASSKLGDIGKSIKDSTAGIRGFVGALTSTVGIVTRMLGLFGFIAAAIGGIVLGAKALYKAMTDTSGVTKELKDRIQAVADVANKLQLDDRGGPGAFAKEMRAANDAVMEAAANLDKLKAKVRREVNPSKTELARVADAEQAYRKAFGAAERIRQQAADEEARIEFERIKKEGDAEYNVMMKNVRYFARMNDEFHKQRMAHLAEENRAMEEGARRYNSLLNINRQGSVSGDQQVVIALLNQLLHMNSGR